MLCIYILCFSPSGVNHTIAYQLLTQSEPWIYCGHLHFIDLAKYNYSIKPTYINIVRDPIERLASFYYYRRDNRYFIPRPFKDVFNSLKNDSVLARQKMSFDECVMKKDIECHDWRFIFQMIPFFCGQDSMCIHPSEEALAQAKRNVQRHFAVVGYVENFQAFLEIVEQLFPLYFSNAVNVYKNMSDTTDGIVHQTRHKNTISPETKQTLLNREDIQLEYKFYKFVTERFNRQYKDFKKCINGNK